ncbi:MAG: ATP-binding protein [Candidatus Binatia bacterium]
MQGEELGTLLRHERGQFLEFVTAYERKQKAVQSKRSEELAREIARLLGGMANADGGTLLVGVERDKSVTGIPHSPAEVQTLVQASQALLSPPLYPSYEKIHLGNLLLLKFEVSPALEVHRVAGGRTFYRIASDNPSIPAEQIQCLRQAKKSFHYEQQTILDATWQDLDLGAIEAFAKKIGDLRDPKVLLSQAYHLIDASAEKPSLRMAALLLFAKDPTRWHPRCGIDFVKYEGTDRQYGSSLNVIKRIRFEAPLCRLIDETVGRIKEHIRERTVLHDLFFRERLEYPPFAWQEALSNAVAHRDYTLTGAPIEVWMFDDRIEVRSPGLLPSPVTLEQLRLQRRIHFSRNPLLVRVLADLGYLREMGEGVPRMFQEMEHYGLRPPEFCTEGFFFTVILRNAPIYDDATLRWLNRFGRSKLSFRQQRLLVYAYSHGNTFSTADYQRIGEVDRDNAYREIRDLVKLGIVAPLRPKSRTYRIIEHI